MIVYRVQSANGKGPYTARGRNAKQRLAGEMKNAHSPINGHPGPYQDFGADRWEAAYEPGKEYVFGFARSEQLVKWFEGWADALDAAGYYVYVYHVSSGNVIEGTYQVAFDRNRAVLVKSFSVKSLYGIKEETE